MKLSKLEEVIQSPQSLFSDASWRYVFLMNSNVKVEEARPFGLLGEYFNNRWIHGDPALTRVDERVDFVWSETDTITPTGQDFISIRSVLMLGLQE